MKLITKVAEMQQLAKEIKASGQSIGYVATMGFLHEGHLQLVQQAKKNDDIVVMSIFVNPLQFGPNEDFDRYPRDIDRDKQLACEHGVDILFYPSVSEMYPHEQTTVIHVKKRVNVLCGKSRPGHFDGVATVVTKFFNLIMPDHVYFGMKDAQQVAVIDALISDLNIPTTLVPCPTVREKDGLAKSSRNVHLTAKERKEAPLLYQCLLKAQEKIEAGERRPDYIRNTIIAQISESVSGKIDYVEILSYPNLTPLEEISGRVIIAIAVQFSNARLIDNLTWNVGEGTPCTER